MKCPKCGSTHIWTTLMSFSRFRDPAPDLNHVRCECGHTGIAHDWGAPLCPPIKGTENWTDEELAEFKKKPIRYNFVGIGIGNTRGIAKLEVKDELEP